MGWVMYSPILFQELNSLFVDLFVSVPVIALPTESQVYFPFAPFGEY